MGSDKQTRILTLNQMVQIMKKTMLLFAGIIYLAVFCFLEGEVQAQTIPENPDFWLTTAQEREVLWSSNPSITIEFQETPLEEALTTIAKQARAGIYFDSDLLPEETINLAVEGIPLSEVLREVLNGTELEAYASGRNIFLKEKEVLEHSFDMEQEEMSALQETVRGRVVDAQTGEALPGVNVFIEGTNTGTNTNVDGIYELNVPNLEETLVFTYIGYERTEILINGRTDINVSLEQQIIAGEELVVVGYGEQTRETLTGSVSSISGGSLERVPATNLSHSLAGQIPGIVSVTSSGEPGSDNASINIRGHHTLGNNSPLVVIDGVPNRSGGLYRLSPSDIENISVLKDASAAIYGSQAANGVILITTKRGHAGTPELTVNISQGFHQPTRIPEMADAATYLTMLNETDIYNNREPAISQETIEMHRSGSDPWIYPDVDYFSEVLKPWSMLTNADISLSGGSESIRYYLSFGAISEDGYYHDSQNSYNQYSFRSNLDGQVTDNITLSFDVLGRLEDRNWPTTGASTIFGELQRGKPNQHLFWPDGSPAPNFEGGRNPAVITTDQAGYNDDYRYFVQSNVKLDMEIPAIEGLSVMANASYDVYFRQQAVWQPQWTLYNWDFETYDSSGVPLLQPGTYGPADPRLTRRSEDEHDYLLNLVVNYRQDLENHSYSVMAGTEYQKFRNNWFTGFRRYFVSPQIDQLFAGSEEEQTTNGSAAEGGRQNYFTRLNYNYQSKYLIEFVGRYDGSYIFPEEGRYGFFPGFSLGWRASQENWFRDRTDFFDELKLRMSWGQTGNDRINEWQYMSTFGFNRGYVYGDREVPTIGPERIPNPNITWEVANQFNAGIEGRILNDRLSFEADYFNYLRDNILHYRNASVPETSGLSLPRENIGEVKSWGYEGVVSWNDNVGSDFNYGISFNLSYATNEIQYWDEPPGAPEWQRSTGSPMNTGLYYKAIGVFEDWDDIENYPSWPGAQPGDIIFEDVNGDGEITAEDRIRVNKTGLPKWTGGINLNATYKAFDFNVFFQGAAGAAQYVFSRSGELGNFFQEFAERRWTPDNPNPNHPRTFNRTEDYWGNNNNTYFLRDADYIRLKNAEIGYNLPAYLSTRLGLQRMRVYANGLNLLTWDTLKIMDPEARNATANYYPQKRVINFGLSLTF
jgi:TonB-dependent starch-binding outer membrane protein SusC